MKPESPLNTLPPVVMILALLIIGIEVVFQLADFGIIGGPRGVGWRLQAVQEFGFSAAVLDRVVTVGDISFDMIKRFVTYAFINQELMQVGFCAALTLALGKFVGEYYGGLRVLLIYIVAAVCGAVVFGVLASGNYPLYGGFVPVYGLIGAYTYALWLRQSRAGENQLLAFRLIGVLLLIQLIFGIVSSVMYAVPPPPNWIAELGGFFAGFAVSTILAPGGWATFLARVRQRS